MMPTMTRPKVRHSDLALSVMLFIITAIALVFLKWAFIDDLSPPLTTKRSMSVFHYTGSSIPEHDEQIKTVRAGDRVFFYSSFCYADTEDSPASMIGDDGVETGKYIAVMRARIVDGYVLQLPEKWFNFDKGCFWHSILVKIPRHFTPGDYQFVAQTEYFLNPLQRAIDHGVDGEPVVIKFQVVE